MGRRPNNHKLVLPPAATYLWRVSDARMRQLAIDGVLGFRLVEGFGRRPTRAYLWSDLVKRWGQPDADRLDLLLKIDVLQIGELCAGSQPGTAVWTIYFPRPVVIDEAGNLATS